MFLGLELIPVDAL